MKEKFWNNFGYLTLSLAVLGTITVGYVYLFAQSIYLVSNGINAVRAFVLKRPPADKVHAVVFFGITFALIVLRLFGI